MAKESVKARDKQKGGKSQKRSKRSNEGGKKVKSANRKKEQVPEWTTGFDPNLMCNRRQARNFCFGSGFAGHDVSACKIASSPFRKKTGTCGLWPIAIQANHSR